MKKKYNCKQKNPACGEDGLLLFSYSAGPYDQGEKTYKKSLSLKPDTEGHNL